MLSYEVEIERPVGEVYRIYSDPDTLPRWLTGLQRTEHVSGAPGEVGSVTKHIYLEKGRIVEMTETVIELEPEKHMAARLETPGTECMIYVDFVDQGETTLMRFSSEFEAQGFMFRLMMPFIKGKVKERQRGDLRRFKALVEAETEAAGPSEAETAEAG